MRTGRVVAALLAIAVAKPAPASADVGDYLNKPVVSVAVVVEGRPSDDPALTSLIQTVVGHPLAMADVRETIGHLFSLKRFEDVRVDATVEGAGVALRYELSPVHPVTRIEVTGPLNRPGINADELRRSVVDRFGRSPSLGRVSEMVGIIRDQLTATGYLSASVSPRADIRHDPDRATLTFAIDPGERTTIGPITITGIPGVGRQALLEQVGIAEGAPYQRDEIEAGLERYLEGRRRLGFYQATIVPSVQLTDSDRVATLTLAVDVGPRVRVVFAGDPLPAGREDDLVPLEQEGSADEDLLEDSSVRIEAYLRAQGYRDATAPFTRQEANGELAITFTVIRGPQYRVGTFDVTGNASVPADELTPVLRTRPGAPFSQAALDADASAVQAFYRRRGFVAAGAEAAAEPIPGESSASVVEMATRISVDEGVRTIVRRVTFTGNRTVDTGALQAVVGLAVGEPFVASQLAADREAVATQYANLGYPNATVTAEPQYSADRTGADVTFAVNEGPRVVVDHVLIVGNTRTAASTIEREMQIGPGDPLGRAAIVESQRRLYALGLFRRVQIDQVSHGDEARSDLIVTVEEAPVTTVGYGAGVEGRLRVVRREQDGGVATERFEVAPRASFEITRRNLFGKNRSLSFFSSVSLHPKDSPFFADQPPPTSEGGFGFPEYRVTATFREPRVAGTEADLSLNGTLEQQIRSSFNYARKGVSATVTRRVAAVLLSGNYQLQRTRVFDESVAPKDQNLLDRTFSQYRLSSVTPSVLRDTRDDTLNPHHGNLFSASAQVAALNLWSEASFLKTFFTGQLFRTLPRSHGTVLAASARVGLGFPGRVIQTLPNGARATIKVNVLPASERFFAGGDTTVRGFALDRLGRPDTIADGFPIGGDGLVIFNGELRVPVWGPLGVVGFVDTGNVFKYVGDIDLGLLRTSVGFGIRFASPFGPIRADLGIKVHPQEGEGLGAFHLSFGQAF
jgi:outer membrane protein insertion porin family